MCLQRFYKRTYICRLYSAITELAYAQKLIFLVILNWQIYINNDI